MSETRQGSFNNWYAKNAANFNNKRRQRYHADSKVREAARARAAEYRQRASDVPEQRDGLNTTARVAVALGISPQTLRNWEARHLIPRATFGSRHRLYSDHQVVLLKPLTHFPHNSDKFKDVRREAFLHWNDAG